MSVEPAFVHILDRDKNLYDPNLVIYLPAYLADPSRGETKSGPHDQVHFHED